VGHDIQDLKTVRYVMRVQAEHLAKTLVASEIRNSKHRAL